MACTTVSSLLSSSLHENHFKLPSGESGGGEWVLVLKPRDVPVTWGGCLWCWTKDTVRASLAENLGPILVSAIPGYTYGHVPYAWIATHVMRQYILPLVF